MSRAVSDLRRAIDERLDVPVAPADANAATATWLANETGLTAAAAEQAVAYLADGRRALGVVPSQDTLVLERFFDESGGMQLVLHAPFGSRITKAWGLALRKRFCRQFNFELQAAATEDGLMLSLGPQHSFPLSDVFRYLHPETTRDVLVQAFLDAPVFETRWRWNSTISLAVPRTRGGSKLAPQVQRMLAADLLASVFPDAAACLENIPGDRQIPDHPLVAQTVRDCLEEAMDLDGLNAVLGRIHRGELRLIARDTPEPSVFAHEILGAQPYAFLDDAPLEERRSHAVQTRRGTDAGDAALGALDQSAIDRVRDEVRPETRSADELHDTLMTVGYLAESELDPAGIAFLDALAHTRRACVGDVARRRLVVTAERLPQLLAIHPAASARTGDRATGIAGARLGTGRGDRRIRPRAALPDRAGHGRGHGRLDGRYGQRRRHGAARARGRRRRSTRTVYAAAIPHRSADGMVRPARCWRASTATPSTGCAPRSSRSARPTSCASCSSGSTSTRAIG